MTNKEWIDSLTAEEFYDWLQGVIINKEECECPIDREYCALHPTCKDAFISWLQEEREETYEGVLEDLDELMENECPEGNPYLLTFMKCKSAVKSRIARYAVNEGCAGHCNTVFGVCPKCGDGVNSEMLYCDSCGQRIKFRTLEENEENDRG